MKGPGAPVVPREDEIYHPLRCSRRSWRKAQKESSEQDLRNEKGAKIEQGKLSAGSRPCRGYFNNANLHPSNASIPK